MHVADAVGILAGCEIVHALVRKPADMRIQHPDINKLALAGFRLMAHRGEDADRRVHTGHQVADRHRYLHRLAVRHAGEAHHAAHRLDQPVVSRPRGVGAGLAKAGDGAIDQAWKLRFQLIVTEAVALQGSGLEVLDQNIAVRHEFLRESLAFRRAEVDGDRALVAVSARVIGALARLLALVIALIGWREAARIVPAAGALHLDHFRAEIAEDLRAMRSGQDAREIKYLNSVERTLHRRSPSLIVAALPYDVLSVEANGKSPRTVIAGAAWWKLVICAWVSSAELFHRFSAEEPVHSPTAFVLKPSRLRDRVGWPP